MNISKKILNVLMIAFIVLAGLGATQTTAFAATAKDCTKEQVFNAKTATCTAKTSGPGIGIVGDELGKGDTGIAEVEGSAISSIVGTMYKFATYISGLIFGVSVIMIVWAGFKYATSQGETKVTEQAKMQIITAGIGIGVALFAMIIVKVFAEIYGVSS